MTTDATRILGPVEFTAALRECSKYYWDRHPFHMRLRDGLLSEAEIRAWVANRWLYQKILAQKNAAVIANCPEPDVRRLWRDRIAFHDGDSSETGGMADWLTLASAVGLTPEDVVAEVHVVPGARFAVDAYLHFVQTRPWTEAVAAALTEMFAPILMQDRLGAFRKHYPWIKPEGYAYFERRIGVVSSDVSQTVDIVVTHCKTREQQDAAVRALRFKCDVLWALADAIEHASTCRTPSRSDYPDAD